MFRTPIRIKKVFVLNKKYKLVTSQLEKAFRLKAKTQNIYLLFCNFSNLPVLYYVVHHFDARGPQKLGSKFEDEYLRILFLHKLYSDISIVVWHQWRVLLRPSD